MPYWCKEEIPVDRVDKTLSAGIHIAFFPDTENLRPRTVVSMYP